MLGQYSGMIAFDFNGDEGSHAKFLDSLKLVTHAVSLGDVESLIVYYDKNSDKLPHYPAVYHDGFFRFSTGLEDENDLIADLKQVLEAAGVLQFCTLSRGATVMMNHTNIPGAPGAIGPYSQAISANGLLFASGQVPLMPGTGEVAGTTIEKQAEQCCKNVAAILDANGLVFTDVVKTICFLADMADFAAFNAVYSKYFVGKPARSCVAVRELPKKLLCEIEIIAVCK